MKKLLLILSCACSCAFAATVEQYSPIPGVEFQAASGGELVQAEVFSGVSGGTAALSRILAVNVYTNAVLVDVSTQITHKVEFSNTVSHVVFTNTYTKMSGIVPPVWCVAISSNTVEAISATTNSWPVLKEVVSETQSLFSETLTGHGCSNVFSNVYLLPGERLVFSGTSATNGWLRLILK